MRLSMYNQKKSKLYNTKSQNYLDINNKKNKT